MQKIAKEDSEFLKTYIDTPTPSGHEQEGQKCWLNYIAPTIHERLTDVSGSVAGIRNPGKKYKVVIEAHVDQVGYCISYIDKKGFIYVNKIGGADPVIAPSKQVRIHTRNGNVPAFFGWPAIHVRSSNQNTPTEENIFIDAGCTSKKQALEMGIDVGCPITFDEPLRFLNEKLLVGPALDNKLGGFILAQVLRKLHETNTELPFTLYAVNSALEETGKMGAAIMGNRLKPHVAIVTDVTHDTQAQWYDKKKNGDIAIGKGPVISYAPTVHKKLQNMITDVAEQFKIPYQKKGAAKKTGTDTDAMFESDSGVASALIALPLRYMHTTVETASLEDVQHAIELIYQLLLHLPEQLDFKDS